MVAPVPTVMEMCARMVPLKIDPPPTVAVLPTCQKMSQGFAPLTNAIVLPVPVIKLLEAWKMNRGQAWFCPSKVTV